MSCATRIPEYGCVSGVFNERRPTDRPSRPRRGRGDAAADCEGWPLRSGDWVGPGGGAVYRGAATGRWWARRPYGKTRGGFAAEADALEVYLSETEPATQPATPSDAETIARLTRERDEAQIAVRENAQALHEATRERDEARAALSRVTHELNAAGIMRDEAVDACTRANRKIAALKALLRELL